MAKDKVTLWMETSKIKPENTIREIQTTLEKSRIRVKRFHMEYKDNGQIDAVIFSVKIDDDTELAYRFPVDHKPLMELARRGETKYLREGDEEQALKIAWRQALMWIRAQLAYCESRMVKFEDVMLPFMMIDKKQTLYEVFHNNPSRFLQLTTGK